MKVRQVTISHYSTHMLYGIGPFVEWMDTTQVQHKVSGLMALFHINRQFEDGKPLEVVVLIFGLA